MIEEKNRQRLVVVSYRLPFHVQDGVLVQNSGGLVSAMLAYAKGESGNSSAQRILWLGVSQDSKAALESATRSQEQECFDLVPVELPEQVQQPFYEGFSNNLIWPLFHYFSELAVYNQENYNYYQQANLMVCVQLLKYLQPHDRLWIHDYHFMLLPRLVREKCPDIEMGFFLHVPFPSYEVFRLMPRTWGKDIVQGLLGADLVGFHTYDYVQHFTQCAIRMAGTQAMGSWLSNEEGTTRVEAFPIGIDAQAFANDRLLPVMEQERQKIREAIGDRFLIFSVDRLDYTKGLLNRLLAFEQFLLKYPQWMGRIVFNMVVVPSRDSIAHYQEMKSELETHVGRINGMMATLEWRPIVYQYRHLTRHEMIALYDVADVGLITPLRDGMNLVCKEFIASQPEEGPGILILSEMAGAAAELREAIQINPNDQEEVVEALRQALEMGDDQKLQSWSKLRDRVFSYDVFEWASDFLYSLTNAAETIRGQRSIPLQAKEIEGLRANYILAKERVILLDYDGTLVPFHREPDKAVPTAYLYEILTKLCADPRNQVAIVSGRNAEFLERWLGELPLHLVAEHGASYKLVGQEWSTIWTDIPDWKTPYLRAMRRVARRCPGSMVEEKGTSLVWHYRNADPVHGLRMAQELREDLDTLLCEDDRFTLVKGHQIVEVRPSGFNKGTVALRLFDGLHQPFVLAVGDDRTDEDLFSVIPPMGYAVKVGKGNTLARFHLRDSSEVVQLLESLVVGSV